MLENGRRGQNILGMPTQAGKVLGKMGISIGVELAVLLGRDDRDLVV